MPTDQQLRLYTSWMKFVRLAGLILLVLVALAVALAFLLRPDYRTSDLGPFTSPHFLAESDPAESLRLWVSADRDDADVFVYLSDIDQNGDAHYVELTPTGWYFAPGHRIRVSLAGADLGNFELNPTLCPDDDVGNCQPTRLTIHRGAATPSAINLPVIR